MSRVNWACNPNYRITFYSALVSIVGPYDREWNGKIGNSSSKEEDLLKRISHGMKFLGMFNSDAHGALGMQHRWCLTTENLYTSTDGKSRFKSIFCNRVAAVKSGYITKNFAIELFDLNGIRNDSNSPRLTRVASWFHLAVTDQVELDEAVKLAQKVAFGN